MCNQWNSVSHIVYYKRQLAIIQRKTSHAYVCIRVEFHVKDTDFDRKNVASGPVRELSTGGRAAVHGPWLAGARRE